MPLAPPVLWAFPGFHRFMGTGSGGGRLHDELLNCEEFENLAEARWFARRRREEHNEERPHSSLNYQTPSAFAAGCAAASAPAAPPLQPRHTRGYKPLPLTQPLLS